MKKETANFRGRIPEKITYSVKLKKKDWMPAAELKGGRLLSVKMWHSEVLVSVAPEGVRLGKTMCARGRKWDCRGRGV